MEKKLRLNYEQNLKRVNEGFTAQLLELEKLRKSELARIESRHRIAEERQQESWAKLAKEILRVRLEFGPEKFGTRFTLYVTMCESFMLNAMDLKTNAPYLLEVLTAKIAREFKQIDFARAKPDVEALRRREVRYVIDSRDGFGEVTDGPR